MSCRTSDAALVHFPVGLLAAAAAADLAGWIWPRRRLARSRVVWLYVGGTASLVATYLAGRQAAALVLTPGMAHRVVLEHWNAAIAGHGIFCRLLLAAAVHAMETSARQSMIVRGVMTTAGLIGIVGLLAAAELGGELVYRWGVGVGAR